jgi:hypothetical protein
LTKVEIIEKETKFSEGAMVKHLRFHFDIDDPEVDKTWDKWVDVTPARGKKANCRKMIEAMAGKLLNDDILKDEHKYWDLIQRLVGNRFLVQTKVSDDGKWSNVISVGQLPGVVPVLRSLVTDPGYGQESDDIPF